MSEVLDKLINKFGNKKVKVSNDYFEKYGVDWYKGIKPDPLAIFFPETEEDLIQLVNLASNESYPIVPSGGRTGLCGGATATQKEIVISLERMNKIEWLADKQQIKCQAGAITDDAKALADENNRLLPISLSSSSSSSIGGNVATNAAGAKFIRYGSTKDYVAKMKVILATGEILELQKEIKKDSTGPNLMEIFFGSEGSLGIIYEVVLNTCEKPTIREDLVIQTDDIEVIKNEILKPEIKQTISSVEFWDTNCQNLLGSNPEAKYFLLVQLASSNAAEIEQCLESLAEKELNISLLNSKQAEEAWAKREDLPVILADNNAYKMDICIPLEQLGNFLLKIEEIGQTEIYSFGHLGDGNIHLNIVSKERELELIKNVYSLLKGFGGSPSAEHGIGQRKKNIWSDFPEYQSKYLLLQKIKKSLDPKNILSPKVFFSD